MNDEEKDEFLNRFGRALFVDGKCVHNGFLTDEKIKDFEDRIKNENLKQDVCTVPYH